MADLNESVARHTAGAKSPEEVREGILAALEETFPTGCVCPAEKLDIVPASPAGPAHLRCGTCGRRHPVDPGFLCGACGGTGCEACGLTGFR